MKTEETMRTATAMTILAIGSAFVSLYLLFRLTQILAGQ